MSGNGGNTLGNADVWMALAAASSASIRLSASAIQPFNVDTVSFTPLASDANSRGSRVSTVAFRSPPVMRANTPFVSSMRRATARSSSRNTIANTAASNMNADNAVLAMTPTRSANTWRAGRIIMTTRPSSLVRART